MAAKAITRIDAFFKDVRENYPGSRLRIKENADKSIDAELMIPVGHRTNIQDTVFEIGVFGGTKGVLPKQAWLTFGTRWKPKEKEDAQGAYDNYSRHRGLLEVFTHYSHNPNIAASTLVDIYQGSTGDGGLKRKGHYKPESLLVRVYWNPNSKIKPERDGK